VAPWSLLSRIGRPKPVYLEDVVHHRVQFPLGIRLYPGAHGNPVEAKRAADVGEHRFHGAHSPAVNVPAKCGIEFLDHLFGKCPLRSLA